MTINKALFSSEKEDWTTPKDLFDELNKKYHFTLDPCSNEENHLCDKYYTIKEDGLKQSWKNEVVFCNPPYGRKIYSWVEKCSQEAKMGGERLYFLFPVELIQNISTIFYIKKIM